MTYMTGVRHGKQAARSAVGALRPLLPFAALACTARRAAAQREEGKIMDKAQWEGMVENLRRLSGTTKEVCESVLADMKPPGDTHAQLVERFARYSGVPVEVARDTLADLKETAAPAPATPAPASDRAEQVARLAGTSVETARAFLANYDEAKRRKKPATTGGLRRPAAANYGNIRELKGV